MNTQLKSMIYLLDHLANHPDYIEEVAQLKFNHWHHTSPDRPWEEWLSEISESARIDSPPVTLVALYDTGANSRDLAGFVSLVQMEDHAGIEDGLWMITLYVKEKYRVLGIGAHLVNRAITEGNQLGFTEIYLWSESRDLTTFYTRRGWEICRHDEESSEDILVMSKE